MAKQTSSGKGFRDALHCLSTSTSINSPANYLCSWFTYWTKHCHVRCV